MSLIDIFKALSDPVRLRMTAVLLDGELSVNELVDLTGMGQSRISRHLKILADSGILQCRRDGLWSFYHAASSGEAADFLSVTAPFLNNGSFSSDRSAAARLRLSRAEKRARFFDRIAPEWDSLKRSVIGDIDLDGEILGRLDGFSVTADLGCGTGELALSIARKGHGVIGVDGSTKMLDAARKSFSDAGLPSDFRIGQLEHLPMRDGEADAAVVVMALHHIPEPSSALSEIFRVLRSGGVAVVADYDRHNREEMREKHHDLWLGFDRDELSSLFNEAGFSVAEASTLRQNALGVHIITAKKS